MTITESSAVSRSPIQSQDQFACFATRQYHISARHLIHKIHMPVNQSESCNQQIADCFNHIKAQGYANPILIAAIPFDTRKNGTLNFYSEFNQTSPAHFEHNTASAGKTANSLIRKIIG